MDSDFFQSAGNPRGGLFAKDTTGTEITNTMNLFLFSSKPALQRAPFWSRLVSCTLSTHEALDHYCIINRVLALQVTSAVRLDY